MRAGAASRGIEPPLGLPMLGFVRRQEGAATYGLPLEANVLVLEGDEGRVVLCNVDTLGIDAPEVDGSPGPSTSFAVGTQLGSGAVTTAAGIFTMALTGELASAFVGDPGNTARPSSPMLRSRSPTAFSSRSPPWW